MPKILQFRRDSAADWTSNDPTLLEGELGYETDTGKLKIGDSVTAWTSLDYLDSAIDHDALINFVSDEHVAHSGVTFTAGKGLSGGGDISTTRTFALDLTEVTGNVTWDDGSPDASITWTYALSGANDPVWTIGNNSMDLTTGALKQGGTQVLLVGDAPTAHTHDGDTLQLNAINSDGGAFSFTTTDLVTFNQSIASANYGATNKLTACATNAGALDFSAASKTLTVDGDAVVSQDYSSDASPTFAGLDLTGITDGRVPYISAAGFTNSGLTSDGTSIGINTSTYVTVLSIEDSNVGGGITISGANAPLVNVIDTTNNATAQIRASNTYARFGSFSNHEVRFAVNNTDKIYIDISGQLGINTSSPDTRLQVVGDCKFGDDNTNYLSVSSTGDISFTGSAGFYPRVLNQAEEPAAGTGATQCDTGELVVWTDTDDAKCYFCYNHSGTVKTVELT